MNSIITRFPMEPQEEPSALSELEMTDFKSFSERMRIGSLPACGSFNKRNVVFNVVFSTPGGQISTFTDYSEERIGCIMGEP